LTKNLLFSQETLTITLLKQQNPKKQTVIKMSRIVPALIVLVLVAISFLLFVLSERSVIIQSPLLIAATIVGSVAILGAFFSLYLSGKPKDHDSQESNLLRGR